MSTPAELVKRDADDSSGSSTNSAQPKAAPTPRPAGRPTQQQASAAPGSTQLLRRIVVAGVTVEVVRQKSTIIYRLPGNMPVSSLTPEQRTKVMDEIQRMRNNPQSYSASAPASQQAARPNALASAAQRPILPNLAPRTPRSSAASSPRTPTSRQPYTPSRRTPTSTPTAPSSQMSALEKIYRSAYMKLLNGPAEVLKKLSPPVELGTILKPNGAGVSAEDIRNPDTLLVILKALTKPQACQLASMYDQDMKLNTGGLRGLSPGGTRSLSRDVSPSPGSLSGSEIENSLHTPGSGTMTPTKKRKYNKTGKYSVKKRSMWTPPNGQSTAVSLTHTPPPARVAVVDERLSRPQRPVKSVHKDLNREVLVPLEERRRRPREIKHENDVSLRFREALAMDHHMVQNPDWRTPFRGTRDVIQRLLPFHVFQYPDAMIDSGIKRKEDVVAASSGTLAVRLKRLVDRYDSILVKEGSASSYSVDAIQMENHRISDVKQQLEQIHDAQLLQSISTTALPHHSSKPRF